MKSNGFGNYRQTISSVSVSQSLNKIKLFYKCPGTYINIP